MRRSFIHSLIISIVLFVSIENCSSIPSERVRKDDQNLWSLLETERLSHEEVVRERRDGPSNDDMMNELLNPQSGGDSSKAREAKSDKSKPSGDKPPAKAGAKPRDPSEVGATEAAAAGATGGATGSATEAVKADAGPPPEDLCTNPVINTIDRMANGTVRVYRNTYFWDLEGFPASPVLSGPQPIGMEVIGPTNDKTKVMSATFGEESTVFKIEGNKFWAINSKTGKAFVGGKTGQNFPVPIDGYLTAVFFNQNKETPFMIGIRGIKVFYYKWTQMKWTLDGQKDGYDQGRNGEKFPGDPTTAFSIPATTGKGYSVYLFKGDKYCERPEKPKAGEDCVWKDNKQLFGCNKGSPTEQKGDSKTGGDSPGAAGVENKQNFADSVVIGYKFLPLTLISIVFNI